MRGCDLGRARTCVTLWTSVSRGGPVGHVQTWVSRGPGSRCGPGSLCGLGLMRWSGSGVVWLDRVMGSLVLSKNSQDL